MPRAIELLAVEIPGRGARLREPVQQDLESLVQKLTRLLLPYFDRPFALFGHSMGALISFELARFLRKKRRRSPVQIFISGHVAPQLPRTHRCIHDLPEAKFIQELRNLDGTPEAVLKNSELMQLLLPVLRADFRVCETYCYTPEMLLACPITVFGGFEDADVSQESLNAWQDQTCAEFKIRMFSGGHFFFQSNQASFLRGFADEIRLMLAKMGEK